MFLMCLSLLEMAVCDFYLKGVSLSLSGILSLSVGLFYSLFFSSNFVWDYTFDLVHFDILCCCLRVTRTR